MGCLTHLLDDRVLADPNTVFFRQLDFNGGPERTLDLATLSRKSRAIAASLVDRGATGQPVILACPSGTDFITGLFAIWQAGAIAVPAYPPAGKRQRLRLNAILADSGAKLILGSGENQRDILNIAQLATGPPITGPPPETNTPALIQYTSGSTSQPKGVVLHHHHLRSHFAALSANSSHPIRCGVSWLPPQHDMGLVLKYLHAFEAGFPLIVFSPQDFIQKPARWLQTISRFQANFSGAPNSAFDACARFIRDEEIQNLDLSSWIAAPCGAERIRPATLDRFAKRFAPCGFDPAAFLPGYGLAEATLIATANPTGPPPRSDHHGTTHTSCGPALPGNTITILNPSSQQPCADREIGEIHLSGPTVASGYWNAETRTASPFPGTHGLATGDLGYLENGHLYVTGRIKDLIILDGVNHAPEDIESALLDAIPELTAAAAIPSEHDDHETLTVLLEIPATLRHSHAEIQRAARRTIMREFNLAIRRVALLRTGLLPRTTSGKIQRHQCRTSLEKNSLTLLADETTTDPALLTKNSALSLVLTAVAQATGRENATPDDDPLTFGIASIESARLAALLRPHSKNPIPLSKILGASSFAEIASWLDQPSPSTNETPPLSNTPTLTHAQQRMWWLHQFDPTSAAYHIFGAFELIGPLNPETLARAFRETLNRHPLLRSRYGIRDGLPHLWIEPDAGNPITLSENSADLTPFARRPFNLAAESPIRAHLCRIAKHRHHFAICAHHLVADGWSLRIIARETADLYALLSQPDPQLLSNTTDDHALQHLAWHRHWIDNGGADSQIEFWKNRLAGHSGLWCPATDFPRPPHTDSTGRAARRSLDPALQQSLRQLALAHRTTPFTVCLAAWLLLLRQHGAGNDAVVAIPVANRHHPHTAQLVSTLVNTLPFRIHLDPAESFSSLLDRIRTASLEMQDHQDAPFERIIEAINPDRSGSHAPIAQILFDYQEFDLPHWNHEIQCQPLDLHRGAVQFDLALSIIHIGENLNAVLESRDELFAPSTGQSWIDRWLVILTHACGSPHLPVANLPALTNSDTLLLLSHSTGPVEPSFTEIPTPQLISRRTLQHPHRTAILCGENQLTYQQLADQSSTLAATLHHHGIFPGDRVALLLERNLLLPVAMLALWKLGAAYVPLDPANPPARLATILADIQPAKALASPTLLHLLPDPSSAIPLDASLLENEAPWEPHPLSPTDPAYLLHTSGSTGMPKGVVIPHSALANFLLSMAREPGFTEGDRLLAITPVSFDISGLELFLPLITGGSLVLAPSSATRDGHALLEILETSAATVLQATPATWRILLHAGWKGSPHLRLLCGGEALDLPLATALRPHGHELWNLYGPTETTIWSALWNVPQNPNTIRIGHPISNTGLLIVDPNGIPTPPGIPGELLISGDGLATGYWNRPDLTENKFPPAGPHHTRHYRTGDIARLHPDGTFECLGRSDGQIKLRGFRIELGEIENALNSHPHIAHAKAALRGSAENARIVAWIQPTQPDPDLTAIREDLAKLLPAHMIPAEIGTVSAFPLNPSGKIDVAALPAPHSPPAPENELPATPTEQRLAAIWQELLDRPNIRRDDHWFHIGGHSLLALRLFARIHQDLGQSLPLATLLESPTLRTLASRIDQSPN
jgi:amino acid adenylation domain-containing protein